MTREGAERSAAGSSVQMVEAAILVMEIEDVFVARMACGGQILANWAKMDALRDRISGTASMIKSAAERSLNCVEVERRARDASASAREMRFLDTSFSSS